MPRRLLGYWPEFMALVVAGPFGIAAFDRVPPQTRIEGYITDHNDSTLPRGVVRIGSSFDVHWTSTPHVRDCPGQVQVEITQRSGATTLIAPVMKRDAYNPPKGVKDFTPEPWPLPHWAVAGDAVYRVSTFWQCNWLQRAIPSFSIYQVGPDIPFKILSKEASKGNTNDG